MTVKRNDFQTIGQFFTQKNVFAHEAFLAWWNLIPTHYKSHILEPFAGRNGIIDMLKAMDIINQQTGYTSYDIMPGREDVVFKDTIEKFPSNYSIVITNPPFLARNSATRKNLTNIIDPYNDLYELCLFKCLKNALYVAAIIPESFITSLHFKNNLYAVISLAHKKIFKNTEQPVCLALFIPEERDDFLIYKNDFYLGSFKELKEIDSLFFTEDNSFKIDFHRIDGQVGFIFTDATNHHKSMQMVKASSIDDKDVTPYARLRTRIKISHHNKTYKIINLNHFIADFNIFLTLYRIQTHDVFLTAFKGLKDNGNYRRRMSFSKLRNLLIKFLSTY